MEELNIGWWVLILIVSISSIVFFGNQLTRIFKLGWFLLIQIVIGSVFIFLFNVVGELFNLYIPLNIFTSLTAGLLGLPGIITILAAQMLVV